MGGMTDIDPRLDRARALARDDELEEVLELLLGSSIRRQLWLIFLDDEHRITGPLMPSEDVPRCPDGPVQTDDLGEMTWARLLGHRLSGIAEMIDAAQVVLVWERPGPNAFQVQDLAWARAMSHACAESGMALRAQFLLHDTGIRMLTLDDHLGWSAGT